MLMSLSHALLVITLSAASPPVQVPDLTPYLMADLDAEMQLARSAAPADVSATATVLVLTRTGFVEAAKGANGFTCVVLRSFSGRLSDPDFWNPHVRAPHCFNPPASRTVLVAMLKQVEWVLSGLVAREIEVRTDRAYASHQFSPPAPGAMAFMLSPEQHLSESDPHFVPHLMFYFDRSQPATAWGAGDISAPIIDGSAGDPSAPVLTLLIPVRRWSDGTTAVPDRRY
jgi:hypothetical protein